MLQVNITPNIWQQMKKARNKLLTFGIHLYAKQVLSGHGA